MTVRLPTEEEIAKVRVGFWWSPLRFAPKVRARVGGVALTGTLEARQERVERAPILPSRLEGIATAPPESFQQGNSRYIVPGSVSAPRQCDHCMSGYMNCIACSGQGYTTRTESYYDGSGYSSRTVRVTCSVCGGSGTVRCTVCEGTLSVVDADIGIVTDERVSFDYTYLPDLPFELEEALYEVFETRWFSWPATQEVSMRETVLADPYRGSKHERASFDFHGFDYTVALSEARSAVAGQLNGRLPFAIGARVHVIPMIIADHGSTPAAHFYYENSIVSVSSKRAQNLPARRTSS